MRYILEASAQEFDRAAEQEILLRYAAQRKTKWRNVGLISVVLVALSVTMASTGAADPMKLLILTGGLVLIMALQQRNLDRAGGNPYSSLKQLYRGRMVQTVEQREALLRLEIDDSGESIEVYNEYGKAGEWSLRNLCRVVEGEDIFSLCCKGLPKQYLALPKSALCTGSLDDLRAFFASFLPEKQDVEYFDVPEAYQQALAAAKAKLFRS